MTIIGVSTLRINSRVWFGVLTLSILTWVNSAYCQDPVDRGIVMLGASYGYYDFSKQRHLDNRDFGGMSLGLHFTKEYSLALFYSRTYVEQNSTAKRRFENYFVEGTRYFNTDASLRPYVVLGLGETLQGEGKWSDSTTTQLGFGLNWVLSPKWSLRGDWRYLYVLDESAADEMFMTSIVYRFSDGEGPL